ncbi:transcriptional regulator [Brachybacterium paraconglomeratum]|uniref:transcriptional regulator n=1 Tax=Brachybacterium paraconglomeratum TaxID=173362 RepID=UPI0031E70887
MSSPRSSSRLLTLHAVRLAGFADEEALADRALLSLDAIRAVLEDAVRADEVETVSFADARGWILTELGHSRLSALLQDQVTAAEARDVVATTKAVFEQPDGVNERFIEVVSRWQLRSTAPTQGPAEDDEAEEVHALFSELATLGRRLRSVLAELIAHLPRFGRYPAQYDAAVRRARTDGLGWVTGVGVLSCHALWAELHQDLRSTAGGDRPAEPESRGERR